MQDVDLHLGRRLHARRRAMGYTLKALASESGFTIQQLQKYECAANRMSAQQLWRLARALEVDVSYFYDGLDTADRVTPSAPTTSIQPGG